MESAASVDLIPGFLQPRAYMKAPKTDASVNEQTHVQNRRKNRKHQRFLLRKAFLQERGLLGKNKSEEHPCSIHEGSISGCLQRDEDNQPARLAEIKATFGSKVIFSSEHPLACDYDSGLSMAGSCSSSRASSPVSWLKPGKCVAIDCEMVGTGPGGKISELARCSVVNYRGDVIYDKYVKPEMPVTDYRTRWSGITKRHLENAIPFKTAKKEILKLLKGKRVIGHALHHDFKVLKYFHPPEQTRDTSEIPLLNQMAGFPTWPHVSLKRLALHILQRKIQVGRKGHSSVEDAQTCMDLYKLVEEQVEQDLLHSSQLSDSSLVEEEEEDSATDIQYMDDQYWTCELNEDCK